MCADLGKTWDYVKGHLAGYDKDKSGDFSVDEIKNMYKDCPDDECRAYTKNYKLFMDFNNDGRVSYGEAYKFFEFVWGMKCHMCSDEFLKRGPQFLTFRVFSVYNYDKDKELNV